MTWTKRFAHLRWFALFRCFVVFFVVAFSVFFVSFSVFFFVQLLLCICVSPSHHRCYLASCSRLCEQTPNVTPFTCRLWKIMLIYRCIRCIFYYFLIARSARRSLFCFPSKNNSNKSNQLHRMPFAHCFVSCSFCLLLTSLLPSSPYRFVEKMLTNRQKFQWINSYSMSGVSEWVSIPMQQYTLQLIFMSTTFYDFID